MSNLLFLISSHLLPFIVLLIPFFLLFDVSLKTNKTKSTPLPPQPTSLQLNTQKLEQKLKLLLEQNHQNHLSSNLITTLENKPLKTISSYLNTSIKNLHGFHFFQHIFSLIKNNTPDEKILKTLRLYFPSSASSHLNAMLKSFKAFLNILKTTPQAKHLETSLYHNNLKPTLLFLERHLQILLTKLNQENSPTINDEACKYCLIFASFSEFYSKDLTSKILKLSKTLSPTIFNQWHEPISFKKNNNLPLSSTLYKKNKKNT